jgi:hypothetical protein
MRVVESGRSLTHTSSDTVEGRHHLSNVRLAFLRSIRRYCHLVNEYSTPSLKRTFSVMSCRSYSNLSMPIEKGSCNEAREDIDAYAHLFWG